MLARGRTTHYHTPLSTEQKTNTNLKNNKKNGTWGLSLTRTLMEGKSKEGKKHKDQQIANSERKLENGVMRDYLHINLPKSCYPDPSPGKYLREENILSSDGGERM